MSGTLPRPVGNVAATIRDVTETLKTLPRQVGDLMETSPRPPDTSVAETSPWCEC